MKILFTGTIEFLKIVLQKSIDLNSQIARVYTKEKSEFNSDFADIGLLCKKKIPFEYVCNINSKDNCQRIKFLKGKIICCG